MRLRNAVVAVVLATAPLAGCSSGDDEPEADPEIGEPATQGDGGGDDGGGGSEEGGDTEADGQGSAAGSGSGRPESVSDDFPVPFPSGWEIDIQGEIGMTNTSGGQLLYPSAAYDGIVAFYDEWFESQPDEFARSVVGEQVFYQLLGETLYQVNVTPDHDERGETWVLLQVSGGVGAN